MPRPSTFTPREDDIILRYEGQPSAVTSAALEAAGFPAQPARRITARRNYLKKKAVSDGVSAGMEQSVIVRLEAERIGIVKRLELLEGEKQSLTQRLEDIVIELETAIAGIGAETARTAP